MTAAKSVADNKDALLEKEVLKPTGAVAAKEEVESKFGAVVPSGPAPSTAAKTPASPAAPAATPAPVAATGYVSLALNEPKASEAKPADGALAYDSVPMTISENLELIKEQAKDAPETSGKKK